MTEQEILAAWALLRDKADGIAAHIVNDAVWAGMNGYRLRDLKPGETAYAVALELAAKRIMPGGFKWEVAAFLGGGAALVLLGYEPVAPKERAEPR